MFTSVALVAVSAYLTGFIPEPSWQADYSTARRLGREGQKPLAVFIASGRTGWNQLSKEGRLTTEINRVLAADYVCVYLDIDRKAAKELASAFEVPDGLGLILSDRTGAVQAFRHEGVLGDNDLLRHLRRYADPERVVGGTEGTSVERASYYAPEAPPAPVYTQPTYYYRSFGGGGRSC